MNIKQFVLVLVGLALAITPVAGLAESDEATTTGNFKDIRQEYREKVKEVRETFREEKKELNNEIKETRKESREELKNATSVEDRLKVKEDRRDEIKKLREEKVNSYVRKITNRLTAALERSARFIARIETILENHAANNQPVANVDQIEAKLAEAEQLINDAESLIADLPTKVSQIISDNDLGGDYISGYYTAIRNAVVEAAQIVKNVHTKIVEAVRLIKADNSENNDD